MDYPSSPNIVGKTRPYDNYDRFSEYDILILGLSHEINPSADSTK
jgi:hypothetical protein